ncbi:DUF3892 domain-containing protein [Sphingobacterium faecium]|uniref:DUF3892 domain-containing protein n=1 Tax=Sphingobacterium faecium TaxID=34087 RepID=UPI003D17ABA1
MAKFYITAVRISSNNTISHVLAHIPNGIGRMNRGEIYSKSEVVSAIQSGHVFITSTFNYSRGKWSEGSRVSIVNINRVNYLRSIADDTQTDNLGNLLLIDELR